MEGLLKIFDPDRHVGVEFMKPSDDFELIEMVVIAIMDLADKNDALHCELRVELFQGKGRGQIDHVEGRLILCDRGGPMDKSECQNE